MPSQEDKPSYYEMARFNYYFQRTSNNKPVKSHSVNMKFDLKNIDDINNEGETAGRLSLEPQCQLFDSVSYIRADLFATAARAHLLTADTCLSAGYQGERDKIPNHL